MSPLRVPFVGTAKYFIYIYTHTIIGQQFFILVFEAILDHFLC